ncbi:MAG TPA: hypothetical protein VK801_11615 [Caulobacteraceae bacterium]|jgi:hypothetical protein|nr:hypothetical protein [Caulobacteraceae bacterium]
MNRIAIAAAFGSVLLTNAALGAPTCPVKANAQPDAAWRSAVGEYCQASWTKASQAGTDRARFVESCLRRCLSQAKPAKSAHVGVSSGPILAAAGAAAGVSAAVAATHHSEKPASP